MLNSGQKETSISYAVLAQKVTADTNHLFCAKLVHLRDVLFWQKQKQAQWPSISGQTHTTADKLFWHENTTSIHLCSWSKKIASLHQR